MVGNGINCMKFFKIIIARYKIGKALDIALTHLPDGEIKNDNCILCKSSTSDLGRLGKIHTFEVKYNDVWWYFAKYSEAGL